MITSLLGCLMISAERSSIRSSNGVSSSFWLSHMLCLSIYFPCSIQAEFSPLLCIGAYSVMSSIVGVLEWAVLSSFPRRTVAQYLPRARSSGILSLVHSATSGRTTMAVSPI